jgi:hypothetical protein
MLIDLNWGVSQCLSSRWIDSGPQGKAERMSRKRAGVGWEFRGQLWGHEGWECFWRKNNDATELAVEGEQEEACFCTCFCICTYIQSTSGKDRVIWTFSSNKNGCSDLPDELFHPSAETHSSQKTSFLIQAQTRRIIDPHNGYSVRTTISTVPACDIRTLTITQFYKIKWSWKIISLPMSLPSLLSPVVITFWIPIEELWNICKNLSNTSLL